ncbi:MAG: hypothetical protein BPH100C_220 [Phage 5P_2]|nr:MAG: hypothetical protein BPH100C_220 [Phage 5P_2]
MAALSGPRGVSSASYNQATLGGIKSTAAVSEAHPGKFYPAQP